MVAVQYPKEQLPSITEFLFIMVVHLFIFILYFNTKHVCGQKQLLEIQLVCIADHMGLPRAKQNVSILFLRTMINWCSTYLLPVRKLFKPKALVFGLLLLILKL